MMMKTALLVTSLVASSEALGREETVKAAAQARQQLQQRAQSVKSLYRRHPQALSALQEIPKSSSKKMTGMSRAARVVKQSRALRGKEGKGKGKNKGDDDSQEDAKMFIQHDLGYCAGASPYGETLTEDSYVSTYGIALDKCVDSVNADGMAFSYKITVTMDPFTVTEVDYNYHGCVEEWMMTSADVTNDFTFGGLLPSDGTCTVLDEGLGYAGRLSITDTPPIDTSAASLLDLDYNHANDCASDFEMPGQYNFVLYSIEQLGYMSGGEWTGFCLFEDGAFTQFDPTGCGESPPYLVENTYSDGTCSTLVDTTTLDAEICKFDVDQLVEDLQDTDDPTAMFTYTSSKCTPNSA